MYIKILTLTSFFAGTCLGVPSPINNFMEKKVFKYSPEPDLQQVMKNEEDTSPDSDIAARSFTLDKNRHWPQGVVPYELDPTFSAKQVDMINQVVARFSNVSCVRWVKRDKNQSDYVKFVHLKEPSCAANYVGRRGGEQNLWLGDNCFTHLGFLTHEMLHALGFFHEQQRIDRDCYVKVVLDAKKSHDADYGIVNNTDTQFPYEIGSLMHYKTTDILSGKNGEKIGNYKEEWTEMDIMKLNYLYCGGKTFCQLRPQECSVFQEAQKKCKIDSHK